METLDEETLARNARAIEVLERLGTNEDRNRGARAREALNSYVGQLVQNGITFSNGLSQLFANIGIRGGQAFDAAENFIEQAPRTALNAVGPNSALSNVASSVGDTLGGFFNPGSALASSESPLDPAIQSQLDQINASDPLATPRSPGGNLVGSSLDSIANFGNTAVPAGTASPPGAVPAAPTASVQPPALSPGNAAALAALDQQILAQNQAVNAQQLAAIDNAVALDQFNRAQVASQLVATPQVQFSQPQLLGNAALAASGVPSSISDSVGALQQLSPSARVANVQPAINASASQTRSVNKAEQAADADRARAVREAQKLAQLKRQAFIDQVVIPRLSLPRD